jgi:hypothetical protein
MILAVFGQIQCIILILTQSHKGEIMAEFKIEIADSDVNRVLGALAANYRRPETIIVDGQEVDNPETIAQFGNRMVRNFLAENVSAHEIRLAKQQAADALNTNVSISDPAV